ncbi:hypothetical protein QOZ89_43890 [Pseudofrankia sp. BMG5.37]|nr:MULTISPECIES: hypothetical protein [unclassified Pseudofrankia]MDT3446464.1 hypothetical protein [Pseudofrankia sp. BMG5.37]
MFGDLGGVRGQADVATGDVLEFRAEASGQRRGGPVGKLAA